MTEIIINDVDISECKFFVKEQLEDFDVYIKNACGINGTECCLVPECYYKQLKRLETENAKLKEALEEIKKISKVAFTVCDDDCGNANKFMDIINKVNEVLKDE